MVSVELDRLILGVFMPRLSIDERWVGELAEDIKHNGLLKPVIVREAPEKPGYY